MSACVQASLLLLGIDSTRIKVIVGRSVTKQEGVVCPRQHVLFFFGLANFLVVGTERGKKLWVCPRVACTVATLACTVATPLRQIVNTDNYDTRSTWRWDLDGSRTLVRHLCKQL